MSVSECVLTFLIICVLAVYKMTNNSARQETKTAGQLSSYLLLCMSPKKYWQAAVFILFTTSLFHPNFLFFSQRSCLYFNLIFFLLIQHAVQLFTIFHSASVFTVKSFTLYIHTYTNYKFPPAAYGNMGYEGGMP